MFLSQSIIAQTDVTNDLAIIDFYVAPNAVMPLSQADSIFLGAKVQNRGNTNQNNINIQVDIKKGIEVVYTKNIDIGTLTNNELDSFYYEGGHYLPIETGNYSINYTVSSDEIDIYPSNNTASTNFTISENTWQKDSGLEVDLSLLSLPQMDNLEEPINQQGILYDHLNDGDYATKARFYLGNNENSTLTNMAGQTVILRLEEIKFGQELTPENFELVGINNYLITAEDNANQFNGIRELVLDIYDVETGCIGVELNENNTYIVSVEYPEEDILLLNSNSHNYRWQVENVAILRSNIDHYFQWEDSDAIPIIHLLKTDNPESLFELDTPNIIADVTSSTVHFSTEFDNQDEIICNYHWDFGDGSPISNLQNPTHSYEIDGTYEVCLNISNAYSEVTSCRNIGVGTSVNTIDNTIFHALTIAPNPASDLLTVQFKTTRIAQTMNVKIINFSGKTFINKNYKNVLAQSLEFNVQELAAGLYILQINSEQGTSSHKIVIK